MFKPEWDCTDEMNEMQREVDYYDRLCDSGCMPGDLIEWWDRLVRKITAWANLKQGLDP